MGSSFHTKGKPVPPLRAETLVEFSMPLFDAMALSVVESYVTANTFLCRDARPGSGHRVIRFCQRYTLPSASSQMEEKN
jgi:hypothetical protein